MAADAVGDSSAPRPLRAAGASLSIGIRHVVKGFGSFRALDDVSLDVAAGEFVTLLGPSGSGKTTLLNVIAGFARPDRGNVIFGADDVTLLPPHKRNIGVVFQNYALFPHMNVAENIGFPLRARGVGAKEIADRVAWALNLVQLGGFGARRVTEMSGGQRQRVALARAIVFEPPIVLMDEPLSALDKQLRERMQIELRHLHDKLGMTTVYVTHDQREALTMSDRVAVMNKGKLIQVDRPQELYERPADVFVADFIGESAIVPVRRIGVSTVVLDGRELTVPTALPDAPALALVIRAEKLSLAVETPNAPNRFKATVKELVYQGESVLLIAELAGGVRISMRRLCNASFAVQMPKPGQIVEFALDLASTVVVPAGEAG